MINVVSSYMSVDDAGSGPATNAVAVSRQMRRRFDGTRGLAALMLGAVVAALVVVADQVVDTWVDGHLMAMWVILWAVAFGAAGVFAGSARRAAAGVIAAADAWSARMARQRADARLWAAAQHDPRVMADIMAAQTRAALDESATVAVAYDEVDYTPDAARGANIDFDIESTRLRRSRLLSQGYQY